MSNYQTYLTISEPEFQALVRQSNSRVPFLIVLTANWLGEGAIVDSIVSKLADQYQNKFRFFRLDVEDSPEVAKRLGVNYLPAIFFFKNGEVVDHCHGMISKKKLAHKVDALLPRGAFATAHS